MASTIDLLFFFFCWLVRGSLPQNELADLPVAVDRAGSRQQPAWIAGRGDGDSIASSQPWQLCSLPMTVLTMKGWGMIQAGRSVLMAGRAQDPPERLG